jgi:hypothetical protein
LRATTNTIIYRDRTILVDGGITHSEVKRLNHELRMKELADRKKEIEELDHKQSRKKTAIEQS